MSTSTQRNPFAFGTPARRTVQVSERKVVRQSQDDLVRFGTLEGFGKFPLVLEPNAEDVSLASWAAAHVGPRRIVVAMAELYTEHAA